MNEYHKIQTVFLRDPETKHKTLLDGQFSLPEFKYLASNEWVFTEKVDGTNIRVMFDGEKITFGGKTDKAQIPAQLIERLQSRFLPQIDTFREKFPDGVCLYGEGYGANIRKGGGNYRPDQDFVLFDVKVGEWWLQRENIEATADNFSLDVVPIVGRGTLYDAVDMTRNSFASRWGDFTAEGLVMRPSTELMTRGGNRIIAKIKHKDFRQE